MKNIILKGGNIFPSKVVCIGRNYTEHIAELNNDTPDEMVFFLKPNSSITNKLVFPKAHESCHYEAEISFLMEDIFGILFIFTSIVFIDLNSFK